MVIPSLVVVVRELLSATKPREIRRVVGSGCQVIRRCVCFDQNALRGESKNEPSEWAYQLRAPSFLLRALKGGALYLTAKSDVTNT